jgi:hypothetical protein
VLERGPGIFRLMGGAAAVREGDRERTVEVGDGAALFNVCSQHSPQYQRLVGTVGKQRSSSR